VIKSGDNLTRIAGQFSTSIAAIAAANPNLDINRIFAGNRIVIPVSRPDFRGKGGAILGPNQTLQNLADQFKVNVDDIARFNGLTSPADAKPGDAILIP
jgi:LysM repeat protein